MKCRTLLGGLLLLSLVAACRDDNKAASARPPETRQGDAEPQVVTMIRQAEDAYATFLEKHEAARSATRARHALKETSPAAESDLLQVREQQALEARAQAAEAKMAMRRTVDSFYQGTDFERAQVAAYLRRSNLREEIRTKSIAAELYASDDTRQSDLAETERDIDAYRQRLAKEDAEWQAVLNKSQQSASAK
ncbi:hypothetical protein [Haloferula sp. BvORR071]|uniref:hypothetical protein n=1 Tax=Haloferula sp. BvORR071 TaxID=1396141 RepID=UPI00055320C0|nr:hypothetical protein [Haloferula sp. BvORR071]